MNYYELWAFDLADFSTYNFLGYSTSKSRLQEECRKLFGTGKYNNSMLCVVGRYGAAPDEWNVIHPVIYNDNENQNSKHPTQDDQIGFVWNSESGDPSHEKFNKDLKAKLAQNQI